MKLAMLLVSLLFLATTTPMIEAKKKPNMPDIGDKPINKPKLKPTPRWCNKCKKCGCTDSKPGKKCKKCKKICKKFSKKCKKCE